MTTRVDIEEIEATNSEKFLAVVLAAFLLIGSIWFYVKVAEWVPGGPNYTQSAAERKALDTATAAYERQEKAERELARERDELELAKNAFDIAVAKGEAVTDAENAYTEAEVELREAQAAATSAALRAKKADGAVLKFERARERADHSGHEWAVAGIRLAFIVGWLFASLRWVGRLRRAQSRFLPLGFAAVGTGVVTALVFATDYITDYIDPLDLGPIVLSAVGAAATIGAFIGLQRWLATRIPGRRVRNGECPFCGHPLRGETPHCEGCGREVIAPCASCNQPRRVGSPHCGACGNP